MTWLEAAEYCEEVYGVFVCYDEEEENRYFICPECGEPLLACDWEDHDFDTCPICEFEWFEED